MGYVAVIDDADAHLASERWTALIRKHTVYAGRCERRNGRAYTVMLHRRVTGCEQGTEPDHIDGDGLNNRRSNLRVGGRGPNMANTGSRGGSSEYKGVFWAKDRHKWRAQIEVNGKRIHIGSFTWEVDAALAYNFAAHDAWGEFARLNT